MLQRITIGNTLVEYDAAATRDAYSAISAGIDSCDCDFCANYRLARNQICPSDFLALLELLGIDYRKEIEVTHLAADGTGDNAPGYGQAVFGHFAFVGRVIDAKAAQTETPEVFSYDVVHGERVHPTTRATFSEWSNFIDLQFQVRSVPRAAAAAD